MCGSDALFTPVANHVKNKEKKHHLWVNPLLKIFPSKGTISFCLSDKHFMQLFKLWPFFKHLCLCYVNQWELRATDGKSDKMLGQTNMHLLVGFVKKKV